MHESILERYRFMVDVAFKKHKRKFKMVKKLDTTNINQNDVSYMVTNLVLDALHDTISEKIGYIDSEKLNQHLFSGSKDYKSGSLPLTSCMKFAGRKGVEESADKIQPIPILVITDSQRKRILTAKKNKKAAKLSSPEYGKTLLYFGGHTRDEDQFLCANKDILSVCKAALSRELKEEIGIDFSVKEIEPSMLIWSHSNERSRRHLAICFIWETDLDSLKIKFDKNEFSSGSDGANAIVNVEDLVTESLESWSMEILKKKFDVFLIQQELVLSGDGVH